MDKAAKEGVAMAVKVVGIDPNLTSTGLVMLQGDKHQNKVLKSGKKGAKRLADLGEQLTAFLAQHKPELAAIEGYAYAKKFGREALGEWGGIARYVMEQLSIPFIEIPPTQLKKYATGRGDSSKPRVIVGVYKLWGAEFDTDDEFDAYVLARIAQAVKAVQNGDTMVKEFQLQYQREVLRITLDALRGETE